MSAGVVSGVVKSEPEFVFELPGQMLTVGQHFRIAFASTKMQFPFARNKKGPLGGAET